ncbi:MAG: cell division protein SepF, partial [Actinomyces graevenitzii]|nr:cell division protein SepF [Actinomyces graevenitzii]
MKALKRMSSAFGYSEIEPETDLVEPFAETEDEYVNEDDSTDYYDDAIIEDREPNPDLARIVTATPTKYNDVVNIGTVYREGTPVIVNLTQINPKEARRIVDFASALIGFVTGSLGCVTILACMFFGALCGSGMATASAIGSMMIPEMKKKGYDVPYATTVVCFAAIVGPIIPPSLSFVLYGAATKTSVPDLFRAGILPGVLIGVLFILMNIFLCKRHGWDLRQKSIQAQADAEKVLTKEEQKALMRRAMKERLHMIWKTFKDGFWALLSPVIILGGIYSGIFTPTEAACVSVVYSIFASVFIYKEMGKKELFQTFLAASVLNGVTSFLLGYSTVFSTFMTFEQVPQMISHFLTTVSENPIIILLLINAILLVIGLFLDTVPAIIVMAPLLLPTV